MRIIERSAVGVLKGNVHVSSGRESRVGNTGRAANMVLGELSPFVSPWRGQTLSLMTLRRALTAKTGRIGAACRT